MKIKKFGAVLIRTIIFLLPGIATLVWLRDLPQWAVAVLAALGAEFIAGVVITFLTTFAAQIKAQRELMNIKSDKK